MTDKRKLLVATDNFLPRHDGIARFLKEVLPVLSELYEVTVVCPNYGPIEIPGIRIVQVPLSNWQVGDYKLPQLSLGAVKSLVLENDVVFCQGLGPIGYAAVRAAHKKKKLVMYTHSIDWELVPKAVDSAILKQFLPDIVKWYVRKQLSKCDLLLVPSESVSEILHWNKIDTRQQVVQLGVNTKEFLPAKDKAAAKVQIGLPKDSFIIGYHGRLAREKDPKTLLRAFMRVKDATLLVVGTGVPEIEKSFERKNVILAGPKDNVVPYLQAMDVYVMPSLTETTCLSVLEAMSCGLPVVSTPVGYVNDYIENGQNGILVPKQNPFAMSKELEKLKASELTREKLGFAARKTVEKDFTWDKTRKRIKEIFEGL
jgi:glycosyltransferase involved in cell wall biosynthesis